MVLNLSNYKKSTIIHGKVEKTADKASHYVDRKQFYAALVERKQQLADGLEPPITNYIGKCLLNIANGLASKWNFANYSYRDEMVSDAVVHCLKYIDRFDPKISTNPFSYYTQACTYLFLNRIRDEKVEQYVKYRSTLESATLNEIAQQPDAISEYGLDLSELDFGEIESFVHDFESKESKAKSAQKKTIKKKSSKVSLDNVETT